MRRPALFSPPPSIAIADEPLGGGAVLVAAEPLLSSDGFEIIPAWQARPPRRLRRLSAAVPLLAAGLRADDGDGARRVRPRDLRSSFATLLIYEGQPPQYVAEQLGHSAATLLRDYARVWEDFDPSQRVSAEEQIERVRSQLHGAEGAQGAARGARRRARSASRKGGRVPQVFRDVSDGSGAENDKTAD